LGIAVFEIFDFLSKANQLCGANKCKVFGVKNEHQPLAAVGFVVNGDKGIFQLCGGCGCDGKRGKGLSNAEHSLNSPDANFYDR
jgi:hypothetical protein